ncbi:hypothetical protein SteCoe_36810 [Stentor coeruleus]|uniref:Uncharacterized protein n=1 Tax=Stentor coeruleus TaxID=5963 RepID=A0A1R2APA6_9CILI|nr:hypothetical protein SteCoe_36810 [Stentor coeruleus]
MDNFELKNCIYDSVFEEIFDSDTNSMTIEELEDLISLAKNQLSIYDDISNDFSVEVHKLKTYISDLKAHIALASNERDKIVGESERCASLYYELIKQRDCLENSLVKIKEEHSKNQDLQESLDFTIEIKKQEINKKERQLQNLLDEYRIIIEGNQTHQSEQTKPNDTPKSGHKSFTTRSISFNFSIVKNNQSKDRVPVNHSHHVRDTSSKGSNVSNNNSIIFGY